MLPCLLSHEADPQSWPVVIIVFAHVVRKSVRPSVPTFQNKTNFATGETVGLAEWIIEDTCVVFYMFITFIYFFTFLKNINMMHTLLPVIHLWHSIPKAVQQSSE